MFDQPEYKYAVRYVKTGEQVVAQWFQSSAKAVALANETVRAQMALGVEDIDVEVVEVMTRERRLLHITPEMIETTDRITF